METIFIVDDCDTNLMAAETALEGKYRTFTMPSAEVMFKLLEKITPDMILMDVEMPEMDGFQAISVLKSDEKLKSIPVIFLTAKHDSESEIHSFEMGAIDFINKPFSTPVLVKRIETHIETARLVKKNQQAVHDIYKAAISVIVDLLESCDKVTHTERTFAC